MTVAMWLIADRILARLGMSPEKLRGDGARSSSELPSGPLSVSALQSASAAMDATPLPGKGLTMRVRGKAGKTQFVESGKEKEEAVKAYCCCFSCNAH